MSDYRFDETALLICDMWNTFCWKPGAKQLDDLAPKINKLAHFFRNSGSLIVHCPSGCAEKYYQNDPARQRVIDTPKVSAPPQEQWYQPADVHPFPKSIRLPDVSKFTDNYHKQHPAIEINQYRDVISEKGRELINVYRTRHISKVYIVGIHLNGCVLSRSFGVRALKEVWEIDVEVVRDLTAVLSIGNQENDLQTMIQYVEKYWCPTITSHELIRSYLHRNI